ncbi:hypothetical protein Q1695_009841 [Nippostrongylus brasiliensis]|nr:hypothetical protein Q1695_009841 [Nippostrongylus brasiliensis]
MPRLRSSRTVAAARSISGLLVNIFRNRRDRFASTSSSEDFVTDSSEETTSSTESTTSSSSSEDEEPRERVYNTRASERQTRQSRQRASRAAQRVSSDNEDHQESGSETSASEEEEEERGDIDVTMMEDPDDSDDVQILDENVEQQSSAVNLAKRRRTDNLTSEDGDMKPSGSTVPTKSSGYNAAVEDDGDGDDGCSICYEEYTSAGEHRLASVKCGHFFGYSCIARWIRSEGRNAVCPTCKTKTSMKDVRKHYTAAVKVTDTSEVEMLRNSNAALHIRVSGLEVELARKDRELSDLIKRLQEGKSNVLANAAPNLVIQPRGGRMFLNPDRKELLAPGNANADARALDFNGEYWAVGVACSQARNLFNPFGIRMLTINRQEFKLREYYPLHSGRPRAVVFSPYESSLLLSGGEDKRAIVSMNGTIQKQWKMPNEKPVWTGCWTAPNKVALGLGDGRVYEYSLDSDSSEPVRDYTWGVGHLPIIFTGYDPASSTLLVASFKKVVAFRNERAFPLLTNTEDQFDKMRSVSFDETSLHFAVTFGPGGRHPCISHRLYRLEVDDDNDEVRCIEMAQWLTDCQMSSTMWSNCLFSLRNSLFSVVYNEDQQRFDAHDWSGRRADAMIRFPSSAVVAVIRAVPSTCDSKKSIVVLADKAIFSITFGLTDNV